MALPNGPIEFSDLRRVLGPNDSNPVSLSQYRPSYAPAYGSGIPGVTDVNISMSQFAGKSKGLKPGFTYRVFLTPTISFSAASGGRGIPGNSYYNGGGGAGGVSVAGYTVSSAATNGGGANGGYGGYGGAGFGAGGGGGGYWFAMYGLSGGQGANGFAYLYVNTSSTGAASAELFYQSNTTYTFTTSGTVQLLLMGGGGGGQTGGTGSGGNAGYVQTYSVNVISGWTASITIGGGGGTDASGGTTTVTINGVGYTAGGGGQGSNPQNSAGSSLGGLGVSGSTGATGSSGGNGGQGTAVFSAAMTYVSTKSSQYFADNPSLFSGWTEDYIGTTTDMSSLAASTGSTISRAVFSVEWFGYFLAPSTNTYTFTTASDDASYVWVGSTALAGYTTSNCVVNNGGGHSQTYVSGNIYLTAGTYYPIRIQYGDGGGGYNFYMYLSSSTISATSNFAPYVYYSLGSASAFPAESARIIKAISPSTNTDGVYYINVNGVSTPTYCLMNSAWNGGGWMMLMKATRGTTFEYSSGYWTGVNTLNTGSTDRTNADAKFDVMNYAMIKDVMAVWPDTGYTGGSIASPPDSWTWVVNNYYGGGARTTALTGFSASNTRDSPIYPNPLSYPGFSSSIWSYQTPSQRMVFGGGTHLGSINNLMRWGFVFNENAPGDFSSSDAAGGIGMSIGWNAASASYSAGDFYGCCGAPGLNRSMRMELYGR